MPLEYVAPTPTTLRWVESVIHPRARVLACHHLIGGLTASMDRITLQLTEGRREVVLRRWPLGDLADATDPLRLVDRESRALDAVRGHGIPAPVLLAADDDGSAAGVPCTLTTCLTGEPDLTPVDLSSWVEQLAVTQAAVHALPDPPEARWDGWYADDRPFDWLTDPGLRRSAREAASGDTDAEVVFVHGDYQHFNILWREGRLTGVVDWPNAGRGSRGADVGHCRLNLAVLFGPEVATDYLAAYEEAAGVVVDPVAELRALLCFSHHWQRFIPRQVAGRAPLDVAGMPGRVAETVRDTLARMD